MDIKTFDRIEKKYLINARQKARMLKAINEQMQHDKYYKSEVLNIYFDTDNYDLIIKSIERPHFKEKLRARSYGGYDKVFLEIKTKMMGKEYNVGYKRRVMITHEDYKRLVSGEKALQELAELTVEEPTDAQVAAEVQHMISHFGLKPKILVYYNRESYVGKAGLRITFDEELRYRNSGLSFTRNGNDKLYFDKQNIHDGKDIIMEIKAHGVMPLWLVRELSRQQAYPMQFSKIGKIYERIQKEQT